MVFGGFAFNTAIFCMKQMPVFMYLLTSSCVDFLMFSYFIDSETGPGRAISLRKPGKATLKFLFGEENFLERYANSRAYSMFCIRKPPKPPGNRRNTSFLSLPGQAGKIQDCSRIHPFPTRNLPIWFFPLLHCIYIYMCVCM